MTAFVKADPYAEPLNFEGKVTLSDFDPSELNGLIADTQGVKLSSGRFDMEMHFACRNGRLQGWIDPRLTGTQIIAANGDLKSALQALFNKISMVLAAPTEGTMSSGRVAVTDNLTDWRLQFWPTVEKVVENALLLGIQEGLKRNIAGKRLAHGGDKPTELKVKQ